MSKVSPLHPYRGSDRFDDAGDIAPQRIAGIPESADSDASSPEAGPTTVVSY